MQRFGFLLFYGFLLTIVRSNPINDETHSEGLKSKLWPTNRTLTWKLNYDHALYDPMKIRQDIEQAFGDWARYTELTFREVTQDEKADFNLAFTSGHHSDETPVNDSGRQISHSFPPGNPNAGHIHFDSTEKWSHTYDGIGYNLRLVAAHEIGFSLGLPHSNDPHSIMSPFYRVILPNQMLPNQDQDNIQALYGKKENSMTTVHRMRYVRAAKKKQKKTKKKQKKTKTTTEKSRKIDDERQLVTFNTSEQTRIVNEIKRLRPDSALTAFKNLSEIIQITTGMLPKQFIPVLQKLSASYSTTTKAIKLGFADLCAVLSKFVIKSWRMIQRGMTEEDVKSLMAFKNQLNTDFKNELAKFIDSSRSDLINIYSQLLLETTGDKFENLLKQKDIFQIDLLRQSAELANKSFERGRIQGRIDSIEYQQKIYAMANRNSKEAKSDMKAEITRLRGQIPEYDKKVKEHRDTHYVERGGIWIFSWKVRDVHIDNGERIARENRNNLMKRIRIFQRRLKNWSDHSLTKQRKNATAYLSQYKAQKSQVEKEYKNLEELYNQTEQKFHVVIQQIDEIYRPTETANVISMKTLDELCLGLQTGSQSLISACEKIQTHLAEIDIEPNSIMDAILDALQLINIADEYNDSTQIKDIKRVLALE